jgi:acetoin:2,6-dichlorophenolindophenol oxidoreductase subunit alpha
VDELRQLELMLQVRRFEEAVWDVYRRGLMPGLAHLGIGQEAVAIGVTSLLGDRDYIVSTHRGHGHCIGKGARLDRMMAELLGKVDGYCRGRGGTMHVADIEHRNLGAVAIVGAGFGMGVGVALACKRLEPGQVAVAFIGEGAMNEGITAEAMNLAALWEVPVVFVCENNQYGEYTPAARVTAGSLSARAAPYGIAAFEGDGMDIRAVRRVAASALEHTRSTSTASFVEFETYRYSGHHVGDQERYRTKQQVEAWRSRDPIDRLAGQLIAEGALTEDVLAQLRQRVAADVEQALEFAKASPFPDPSDVEAHVYA